MSFQTELENLLRRFGFFPNPVVTVTPSFDVSGWAFNAPSDAGGLISSKVEATRAELVQGGYKALADLIPKYWVGRYWTGADTVKGFAAPDPDRFVAPTDKKGMSDDVINQLLANVTAVTNRQMSSVIVGTDISTAYRGEFGAQGFTPVVPGTNQVNFSPAPIYNPSSWSTMFPRMPGNVVYQFKDAPNYHKPTTVDALMDHFGCDVWWDFSTDTNINNYVRSFAIANGAKITL